MNEFKDHFSRQAGGYTRYRPHYPEQLFSFLASLCAQTGAVWDCAAVTARRRTACGVTLKRFTRPRPGLRRAAVGYGLMRINPDVDAVIDRLYTDLLADDWPPERRHIDASYRTVPFPFGELAAPAMAIEVEWNLEHCYGYLETWSAVQQYRQKKGECPLALVDKALKAAWGDPEKKHPIRWPLFFRIGRIDEPVDQVKSTG